MRLFLLTSLTMVAFAANSVLNRAALADGGLDAFGFGALRLLSGAVVLAALVLLTHHSFSRPRLRDFWAAAALLIYVFGFSLAYRGLDAGLGALILFGVVQVTMFAGALTLREPVPGTRWAGAVVAFAGLTWLLWPGRIGAPPPLHVASMAAAGVAWGMYSLLGRGGTAPLRATGFAFILAAPVAVAVAALQPEAMRIVPADPTAVTLALISGGITSGLGYALWYRLLPALGAARAAVAQLSVPVIALAGGALALGERPDATQMLAGVVVLAGVALAGRSPRR